MSDTHPALSIGDLNYLFHLPPPVAPFATQEEECRLSSSTISDRQRSWSPSMLVATNNNNSNSPFMDPASSTPFEHNQVPPQLFLWDCPLSAVDDHSSQSPDILTPVSLTGPSRGWSEVTTLPIAAATSTPIEYQSTITPMYTPQVSVDVQGSFMFTASPPACAQPSTVTNGNGGWELPFTMVTARMAPSFAAAAAASVADDGMATHYEDRMVYDDGAMIGAFPWDFVPTSMPVCGSCTAPPSPGTYYSAMAATATSTTAAPILPLEGCYTPLPDTFPIGGAHTALYSSSSSSNSIGPLLPGATETLLYACPESIAALPPPSPSRGETAWTTCIPTPLLHGGNAAAAKFEHATVGSISDYVPFLSSIAGDMGAAAADGMFTIPESPLSLLTLGVGKQQQQQHHHQHQQGGMQLPMEYATMDDDDSDTSAAVGPASPLVAPPPRMQQPPPMPPAPARLTISCTRSALFPVNEVSGGSGETLAQAVAADPDFGRHGSQPASAGPRIEPVFSEAARAQALAMAQVPTAVSPPETRTPASRRRRPRGQSASPKVAPSLLVRPVVAKRVREATPAPSGSSRGPEKKYMILGQHMYALMVKYIMAAKGIVINAPDNPSRYPTAKELSDAADADGLPHIPRKRWARLQGNLTVVPRTAILAPWEREVPQEWVSASAPESAAASPDMMGQQQQQQQQDLLEPSEDELNADLVPVDLHEPEAMALMVRSHGLVWATDTQRLMLPQQAWVRAVRAAHLSTVHSPPCRFAVDAPAISVTTSASASASLDDSPESTSPASGTATPRPCRCRPKHMGPRDVLAFLDQSVQMRRSRCGLTDTLVRDILATLACDCRT
ncbi:hypothetical protein BC828DRAFT_384048 [Blastocladiella britannica]|nr:hypothetical protein BC828DRAFT_384048 [Blastocladiella britannica]